MGNERNIVHLNLVCAYIIGDASLLVAYFAQTNQVHVHVLSISIFHDVDFTISIYRQVSRDRIQCALQTWCIMVGAFVSFSFSASSIWLYLEALWVHYAVTAGRMKGRAFKCYMPLGWALPLVFLGAIAVWRSASLGADWRCWPAYDDFTAHIVLAFILAFSTVST